MCEQILPSVLKKSDICFNKSKVLDIVYWVFRLWHRISEWFSCKKTVKVSIDFDLINVQIVIWFSCRSAIHAQALSEISMANERLIRPCISKLKTQEKDAPNAELLRLISVLSDISNRIEDCPATENEVKTLLSANSVQENLSSKLLLGAASQCINLLVYSHFITFRQNNQIHSRQQMWQALRESTIWYT